MSDNMNSNKSFTNWSFVCDLVSNELLSNHTFVAHFKSLSTNEQRVKYCLSQEKVKTVLTQLLAINSSAKHRKYGQKAKEFRIEGNLCFKKRSFPEAIDFYTNALLCASFDSIPNESQTEDNNELSLAFANRSAVFFHLKQYDNCLKDISNAIKNNYPLNQMKLWLRKANCLIEKELYKEAEEVLNYADINGDTDRDNAIKIKSLFKLLSDKETNKSSKCINRSDSKTSKTSSGIKFESNAEIPNASSMIELCSSQSKGRYIKAKQDIDICDILFMERPFASVLLPQFYKSRCHHCYKKLTNIAVMPCNQCTQVRYCSDDCVDKSWMSYHLYECGHLDLLHDIGIAHLALRVLLVSGIEQTIEVSTRETSDMPYLNNYSSVNKLVDHCDKFKTEDMLSYSLVASLLLLLSEKLGLVKNESRNYDLIGGVLLKHILQLITNGHAISSFENKVQSLSGDLFEDSRIATAIYPTVCLMNHSCDPNVIAVYDKDLLIIRAAKNISKGEEVMNCYGPHCKRMFTKERQSLLMEQYFFKCDCKPCSTDSVDMSGALSCPHCKDALIVNENKDNGYCLSCKRNDFNIKLLLSEVNKGMIALSEGSKLIDENKILDSEEKLLESHRILQTVLYSKNKDLGEIKDELSRCYAQMNDWPKAVKYGRESVDIVRDVFGDHSIEMSNELIKLSDLEWQLLDSSQDSREVHIVAKKCLVTTSKAIKLLTNYSVPTDQSCDQMDDIKRLEERLVCCDLFIKQLNRN